MTFNSDIGYNLGVNVARDQIFSQSSNNCKARIYLGTIIMSYHNNKNIFSNPFDRGKIGKKKNLE